MQTKVQTVALPDFVNDDCADDQQDHGQPYHATPCAALWRYVRIRLCLRRFWRMTVGLVRPLKLFAFSIGDFAPRVVEICVWSRAG